MSEDAPSDAAPAIGPIEAITLPSVPPPSEPPLRLHELFAWLQAHEISAYPPPEQAFPVEVEGVLIRSIIDDLAGARRVSAEALREEVQAWLLDHFISPPEVLPAPLAIAPGPRRREGPRIVVPLCQNGCCFECDSCAAKPGQPVLCPACQEKRADCARRHPPHAPVGGDGGDDKDVAEIRRRLGADLRRIAVGALELSSVLLGKTRWGIRHGLTTVEQGAERAAESAFKSFDQFVERSFVGPVVVRVMRLAAVADGGPKPAGGTRDAVLAMVYGPDKARWPTWAKLDP